MAEPHDAMLWEKLDGQTVRCGLCGHECVIAAGKYGICRVRQNVAGAMKSVNYGFMVAMHVDPIEKKPLFHFLPGTQSLSVASVGCNFQCEFCQNWQISQLPRSGSWHPRAEEVISPEQIVTVATPHDCASIIYTYTEPTVFFELAYETAQLARKRGIRNCFVSNGYMTPSAVRTIAPYLDAINVDLKAFRDETYQRVMKASLAPVLTCLESLVAAGVWVEVTTLVVPGMNDSSEELRDIAQFIAGRLGPHVPWHVSRFHGDYKMGHLPDTPIASLQLACKLAAEAGLKYVYCGNVPGHASESTYCKACGELVIERMGFAVRQMLLRDGACENCGAKIEGLW